MPTSVSVAAGRGARAACWGSNDIVYLEALPVSSASPSYADRMRQKLTEALAPTLLEIVDDSARHHGHAGHREGGETHFNVLVVSEQFAGLGRVARQRRVYDIVRDELAERVHALSLITRTVVEHQSQKDG